jgi:hypothetical protein
MRLKGSGPSNNGIDCPFVTTGRNDRPGGRRVVTLIDSWAAEDRMPILHAAVGSLGASAIAVRWMANSPCKSVVLPTLRAVCGMGEVTLTMFPDEADRIRGLPACQCGPLVFQARRGFRPIIRVASPRRPGLPAQVGAAVHHFHDLLAPMFQEYVIFMRIWL